ncbi:hypothetical protein [Spirillospora sp. NPDC047279]|uniref:hypothetical protein n=1 Tax=Spirillospora sp. NPDC047279 TaxID=3155478 RepID=UPI0033F6807A
MITFLDGRESSITGSFLGRDRSQHGALRRDAAVTTESDRSIRRRTHWPEWRRSENAGTQIREIVRMAPDIAYSEDEAFTVTAGEHLRIVFTITDRAATAVMARPATP